MSCSIVPNQGYKQQDEHRKHNYKAAAMFNTFVLHVVYQTELLSFIGLHPLLKLRIPKEIRMSDLCIDILKNNKKAGLKQYIQITKI